MITVDIATREKVIDQLVDEALNDLETAYRALDHTDGVVLRNALIEIITDLLAVYGDAAGVQAVENFLEYRAASGIGSMFVPELAKPVTKSQVESSVRFLIAPIFQDEPDPDQVLSNMKGVVDRYVRAQARDTITLNVSDPASGSYAYARILGPGDTCDFCLMLSSRGPVYRSASSAGDGNKFHDRCSCRVVPFFEGMEVQGYDHEELKEEWKKRA